MEMKVEEEEEEEEGGEVVKTSEEEKEGGSGFEPATCGVRNQLLLPVTWRRGQGSEVAPALSDREEQNALEAPAPPLLPDRATSTAGPARARARAEDGDPLLPHGATSAAAGEGGSQEEEKGPEEPKSSTSTSLRRMECIARDVACDQLDQRGNPRTSFRPPRATWQREEAGLKPEEEGPEEWRRTSSSSSSTSASLRRMECIARHVACAQQQQQDERGGSARARAPSRAADRAIWRRRETRVGEAESQGIRFAPEVRAALLHGKAVVALESTIISHGMPYPANLRTAMEVEEIVRLAGAVPATIAIMAGIPKIGLSTSELEELAKLGKAGVQKTSRRDIAQVVAQRRNGATTVSATMLFAAAAGIPIFVTGGIGGVHRGAETSMDISADLTELGRTPVAVICAGVKSILDIPKTLEWLETKGVTVVGYGTDEFPAFFTVSSGSRVSCRMDAPETCAALIAANRRLNLGSGILIGVPIPPKDAPVGERVEAAIAQALKESRGKVEGSEVTPFLLNRVNELTHGESLAANVALIKNNARVGAKIAVALQSLLCLS